MFMLPIRIRLGRFAYTVCIALSAPALTVAQTSSWSNSAGGSYDTAGNWTPSGIPGSGATIDFTLNSNYVVQMPSSRPATTMNMTAGTVTFASSGTLTRSLVLSQDLNLTNGLLTLNDVNFVVGNRATVNNGGRMRVLEGRLTADHLRIGTTPGGHGSLSISGGSSSLVLIGAGTTLLGQSGSTGTLTITNGATATLGGFVGIAASTSSNSSGALVLGTNAVVSASSIAAGNSGFAGQAATISLSGGAQLTQAGSSTLTLGAGANSTGFLSIDQGCTFTTGTGPITVHSTGSILIAHGGRLIVNGNLTINGGRLLLNADPFTPFINFANELTVTVQNGGIVERTAGSITGGISTPASGTLLVTGAGSIIRDLAVGVASGGTLIVANGGRIHNHTGIGGISVGPGTLIVDGGSITDSGITLGAGGTSSSLIVRNNGSISSPIEQLTISTTQANVSRTATIDTGGIMTMREMWLGVHAGTNSTAQMIVGAGGTLALTGGSTSRRLLLGGSANVGSLNVLAGGTLVTGSGTVDILSNGNLNLAGRWVTGAGLVNVSGGSVTQSAGSVWSTVAGSEIQVHNGGSMRLAQLPVAAGGSLTVTGPTSFVDAGTFNVSLNGTAFVLGGASLSAGQIVVNNTAGARLIVDGADSAAGFTGMTVGASGGSGSVSLANGARVTVNGTLTSAGAGSLTSGLISVIGGSTMSVSHLSLAPQATGNQIHSNLLVDGFGSAFSVSGNTTVGPSAGTGGGSISLTNAARFSAGTGTLTVNPLGRIDVRAGTFAANGNANVHGQVNIGGSQSAPAPIPARFDFAPARSLVVSATGSLNLLDNGLFTLNGGLLNLTTPSGLIFAGGSFNFNAGTVAFAGNFAPDPLMLSNILGPQTTLLPGHALSVAQTLTLTSSLAVDGGTLSAGSIVNANNLVLRAGRVNLTGSPIVVGGASQFGAALDVPAGITFAAQGGGTIGAAGQVRVVGGTLLAPLGLNVAPGGELRLASATSRVQGGTISNAGLIAGTGRIESPVANSAGGVVRAGPGEHLTLTAPTFTNAGTLQLLGGVLEFAGSSTNNAGATITGHGSLFAGSLLNNGSLTLVGDQANVFGTVTNGATARVLVTTGSRVTFFDALTNQAGSVFRISDASVAAFLGPVAGMGAFTGSGTAIFESTVINGAIERSGTTVLESTAALSATRLHEGTLIIRGGSATVTPDGTSAATSRLRQLQLNDGRLDLNDNDLIIDYDGPSPIASVRAQIAGGFNGGDWSGPGIATSMGNASQVGLGYAEASAIFGSFPATFSGQSVDNTSVLVMFTRFGDANLNGVVNLQDFNRLASNFGSTSAVWSQGDFNYDGIVNLQDFNRLAANFGLSASGPEGPTPQDWATLAAAVPEPAAAALAGAGLLLLRRRARARR